MDLDGGDAVHGFNLRLNYAWTSPLGIAAAKPWPGPCLAKTWQCTAPFHLE
jgi:hypothetical protein